jgi:REP element-mobilizing transposase RayT
MANTYSQISMHIVFAVKYRESLLVPEFRVGIINHLASQKFQWQIEY